MKELEAGMARFIGRHHLMMLATQGGEGVHAASLFYAWEPESCRFIFTSAPETLHARHFTADPRVAAAIAPETSRIGRIRGVQLRGRVSRPEAGEQEALERLFRRRFPFAALMSLDLWVLEPEWIKYTDNTLGFGTKSVWERA